MDSEVIIWPRRQPTYNKKAESGNTSGYGTQALRQLRYLTTISLLLCMYEGVTRRNRCSLAQAEEIRCRFFMF